MLIRLIFDLYTPSKIFKSLLVSSCLSRNEDRKIFYLWILQEMRLTNSLSYRFESKEDENFYILSHRAQENIIIIGLTKIIIDYILNKKSYFMCT